MPSRIAINLFGLPEVLDSSGKAIPGLGLGKPLALLAYILVEGRTSRNELMGLLWGDVPESKARNAFRQALHRLRTALGEGIIPQDPEMLFVADDASIATDLQRFERFFAAGEIEKAIGEYRGDFLSGLEVREPSFDSWQESKRKRYAAKYRDALRGCIQADIESGEIVRAVERALTLEKLNPTDPECAILHATTLLGAGRRAEALHGLDDFERRFKEEMGLAAPPAIRELAARLRRAPADQSARGPGRARTRFVGRETELALLLGRLGSLESNGGSVVLIEGEHGVGKTRLIDEFFSRATDLGSHLLLLGRERSPDAAIAYASLAEALRGLLDAPGLAGTGQHLLAEAARLLPQLRDQFSLPAIAEISDDAGRLRFYEGIAALLDSVAYEQPVCIALDDFHNCTSTTFGLVQYLIERLRGSPIFFVLAGRSTSGFAELCRRLFESLGGGNRNLAADSRQPLLISLGPLDEVDAEALAKELAGDTASAGSVEDILSLAGGIPYRLVEAAERVRSGETFDRTPAPIRDVLWSRLQRCTQAEQRLFVAAALFDKSVPIRLLAAASHLPEQKALDAAVTLETQGFLHQRGDGMLPAHDFAGELALEGTGPAGRALLAGWAAEALERDRSGTAAELARLFALAGRRKEAFTYSREAAFEAIAAGAPQEGIRFLETALATAPSRLARDEIDVMLRSLGHGLPRISGSSEVETASTHADGPVPHQAEPDRSGSTQENVAQAAVLGSAVRPWRRFLLVGVGLAALVFVLFRLATATRFGSIPGTSLADTLVVAREINPRDTAIVFTTGPLGTALGDMDNASRHGRTRTWVDSLKLPWTNPLPAPDGKTVAMERITEGGTDLYVVSANRRDTTFRKTGGGDYFVSGWSPDSRWLLATHGESRTDGSYTTGLYGYSVRIGERSIAFDTTKAHGVVEASWSPDGSHVAWTARIGIQQQQDIFLSDADGKNVTNLTDDPGEDYSIAWSPDGSTLAFTSERSSRADLYSLDIATRQLRRLTWEGAHADHAIFSPDGRWLAYESTKGGSPAVYVMPSGGGTGRSVSPPPARVTLVGWRGETIPYLDQLVIVPPRLAKAGDTSPLVVGAIDRKGRPVRLGSIRFDVLDPQLIRLEESAKPAATGDYRDSVSIRALGRGLARISVSAGSWRVDTAFIAIGDETLALLEDDFERGLQPRMWRTLGSATPSVERGTGADGSAGLVAHSGREWESGVLSQTVFPIHRGLTASVWVKAPFTQPASAARSFVFALVAADPAEAIDSIAPTFLRLATVSWLGEAGRLSYGVGREIFTEPLGALGAADYHRITIAVATDDRVTISIDGVQRWKSSLRVRTEGDNSRGQLWLGSKGSKKTVVFDNVTVQLEPPK